MGKAGQTFTPVQISLAAQGPTSNDAQMVMMVTVVMMTIDHVEGFVDNLNLNHISELFLQSPVFVCKYKQRASLFGLLALQVWSGDIAYICLHRLFAIFDK